MYAAYDAATKHTGQPTVILAKTVKGWTLGSHFEGRNSTHQMKKLKKDDLIGFRDRLEPRHPGRGAGRDACRPTTTRARTPTRCSTCTSGALALGGYLPSRRHASTPLVLPGDPVYDVLKRGSGKQKVATTMAFVRLLKELMKDKEIGWRFVPVIPDEARTFGLDSLFPTAKIYSPHGQNYTSVDRELVLSYKEDKAGVILHEGINEAGSTASWTAVGTSYATHGIPMIPIYIFYSMFGFQRTGDAFWAAGDQMTRGFVLGATAGRTTLNGEGLQHEDGHSMLLASTNPAVVAYDPAFGFELAHIIQDALRRMYGDKPEEIFYYLTIYNEPYAAAGRARGRRRRGHPARHPPLRRRRPRVTAPKAQVLASGVAVQWALEAQRLLHEDWNVQADVWSVTSWNELRRDGLATDEHNFMNPDGELRVPYVTKALDGAAGPVRRGVRLHARGAGPDRAVGAGRLRVAGHRRLRPVRHPRGAAPALQGRRRLDRGQGARRAGPARRGQAGGHARGDRPLPAGRRHRRPRPPRPPAAPSSPTYDRR